MTIDTEIHPRLSLSKEPAAFSGAMACVFNVNGIAYKVFRVFAVANPEPVIVKARFESEIEAYEVVNADPWLQMHTPHYYGATTVEDILENDESVRDRYALDCCYRIEVLTGDEQKFLSLRNANKHLQKAQERFRKAGIDLGDASVFDGENPEQFKLIDFRFRPGC